jgi:antitoxin component HigA of HigAB toxin-antitoxin module
MATELKPIRTKTDYKSAMAEVEHLWGAKSGTAKGDRLDVLVTLIEAYEAGIFRWTHRTRSRRSNSAWSSKV